MNGIDREILELAIPILAIGGGLIVAIIAIVVTSIQKVMMTRAREQTRREVAAYVAEGTISPDDAVRILSSGRSIKEAISAKCGS
jgi:hypothetical protein